MKSSLCFTDVKITAIPATSFVINFRFQKGKGREKALASAGHVTILNIQYVANYAFLLVEGITSIVIPRAKKNVHVTWWWKIVGDNVQNGLTVLNKNMFFSKGSN